VLFNKKQAQQLLHIRTRISVRCYIQKRMQETASTRNTNSNTILYLRTITKIILNNVTSGGLPYICKFIVLSLELFRLLAVVANVNIIWLHDSWLQPWHWRHCIQSLNGGSLMRLEEIMHGVLSTALPQELNLLFNLNYCFLAFFLVGPVFAISLHFGFCCCFSSR